MAKFILPPPECQDAAAASAARAAHLSLVSDRTGDDGLAAAERLYAATLELLNASSNPQRDRHRLIVPLSQVVARQKTRAGQADCAMLADALARADHGAALDACRRLIEQEKHQRAAIV